MVQFLLPTRPASPGARGRTPVSSKHSRSAIVRSTLLVWDEVPPLWSDSVPVPWVKPSAISHKPPGKTHVFAAKAIRAERCTMRTSKSVEDDEREDASRRIWKTPERREQSLVSVVRAPFAVRRGPVLSRQSHQRVRGDLQRSPALGRLQGRLRSATVVRENDDSNAPLRVLRRPRRASPGRFVRGPVDTR